MIARQKRGDQTASLIFLTMSSNNIRPAEEHPEDAQNSNLTYRCEPFNHRLP